MHAGAVTSCTAPSQRRLTTEASCKIQLLTGENQLQLIPNVSLFLEKFHNSVMYTNQTTSCGYSWSILQRARWSVGAGKVLCPAQTTQDGTIVDPSKGVCDRHITNAPRTWRLAVRSRSTII
jgi:hypothetical protein